MATVAAGGALAAFLGAVVPGIGGAILGAALTPGTTRLIERAAAEWGHKRQVIEAAALNASGISGAEEFCEILSEDSALIALVQKIAWAASQSGNEPKLRGLGALLGGAVANRGDRLDETQMLVAALADMEAPHAIILDVLTRPAPDDDENHRAAVEEPEEGPHLFPSRVQNVTVSMAHAQVAWLP